MSMRKVLFESSTTQGLLAFLYALYSPNVGVSEF